ncbi:hypothetical protein [Bdellovibrio sp. HCB209]|uniref:hypothetical protein n=1 Tax=Bdellovibrio sp. HCB209 TaxID=3394354 RepID=UPI0039B584F4
MKYIFSSLVILLSTITGTAKAEPTAGPIVDPTSICNGGVCSEQMNNIVDGYKEGSARFLDQSLIGYSGKCFHLSPNYNSGKAHHGGFVFQKDESSLGISGIFSFFYEEDPLADMTSQEMKQHFEERGSKLSPAKQNEDNVELAHIFDETDIRYSYRSDASKKNLFVIGSTSDKGGNVSSAVFCKMIRHQ